MGAVTAEAAEAAEAPILPSTECCLAPWTKAASRAAQRALAAAQSLHTGDRTSSARADCRSFTASTRLARMARLATAATASRAEGDCNVEEEDDIGEEVPNRGILLSSNRCEVSSHCVIFITFV